MADRRINRAVMALRLALIYGWLTILAPLAGSDAYYSVYLLVAVLALACGRKECPAWWTRKKEWAAWGLAVFLSLAVVWANYALLEPWYALESKASGLVLLAGGMCVAYPIIRWVAFTFPVTVAPEGKRYPAWVFGGSFLLIALVDLGYLFGVKYPGILTRDSLSTVMQILGMTEPNNVMPYWHTRLVGVFFQLGMWLTGDINGAVATFHVAQILMMAGCLAYGVVTLHQLGAPAWVQLGLLGFCALIPYNIAYSVTLWKDVPFAGALLLMTVAGFRILAGIGKKQWGNRLLMILGAAGFSLLRTNGWYAFAVTVAVALLSGKDMRRRMGRPMLLVLLGTWFLLNPMLDILQVGDMEPAEAFAVPMQQVARVVSQGYELEEEERQLLGEIFDLEQMAAQYTPGTVDPVKFNTFRYDKEPYIRENWWAYTRLYLRLGLRYPGEYFKAWVEETKGYWNAGYAGYIWDNGCEGENLGIYQSGASPLAQRAYGLLFRAWEKTEAVQFAAAIGLFVWVLILLFMVCLLQNRQEAILFVPLLVLAVGLWLGTPVYAEFRYGYPFALCAPFLLCACAYRQAESAETPEP